jgi:stage II sporulation protein AA (anti-sigma F factor antagonist)
MGVTVSINGDEVVARLDGDIDHHTAQNMRDPIDEVVNSKFPKILNLDFSGVQFMDSSGIGLIMGRYRLMQSIGGVVKVINMPAHIEKLIKLSGLGILGLV